ncbi:MAG: Oxidoreductase, short chain dehydrogenase/reductase family protein [Devosia sp.]|uniref:SDR family NAD(P)-dependent oxidoreductase n=1 Tax=Devosia sp. TaxID=1871048 RepID=UPI0026342B7A|nr:SDR family oxidoreductase [Devosia sp.]MDB5540585.1 Oxidoreductase, short chain dehydrogenase/reductase family protein [Devosia sp.]
MSLFDLTGKIAVVTGATKGIGLGIAQELVKVGAKVIVSSRSQEDCDRLAMEFGPGVAKGIALDLENLDAIEPFAAAAVAAFGGVDILVCNAAVLAFVGPASKTPPQLFDRLLKTNVHHNFRLCEALRPAIAARGGGSITLIGSGSGHHASPFMLAYGVSKAGLSHLALSLADEMVAEGIRVNCVAAGVIRSKASERMWRDDELLRMTSASIPLQRIGEPEDIAGTVIFLASQAGSYITGETIMVDGGKTALSPPASSSGADPTMAAVQASLKKAK